jgi:hypothetical protein
MPEHCARGECCKTVHFYWETCNSLSLQGSLHVAPLIGSAFCKFDLHGEKRYIAIQPKENNSCAKHPLIISTGPRPATAGLFRIQVVTLQLYTLSERHSDSDLPPIWPAKQQNL